MRESYPQRMSLVQSIAFVVYAAALRVNEWTAPTPEVRELRKAHRIRVMQQFESPHDDNKPTEP